jgi:hypothetical protein
MQLACTLFETPAVQQQMAQIRNALHERLRQELRGQRNQLHANRGAIAARAPRHGLHGSTAPNAENSAATAATAQAPPAVQAWWHDPHLSVLLLGSMLDPVGAMQEMMDGIPDADHELRRHRMLHQHMRRMHELELELMDVHAWAHARAHEPARGAVMHRAQHMMRHAHHVLLPGAGPGAVPAQLLNSTEAAARAAAEPWAVTLATARDILAHLTRASVSPAEAAEVVEGEGAVQETKSAEVVAQTSKVCPGCFQQITRFEGCNLMHHAVVSCGAKFCWRCLRTGIRHFTAACSV